MEGQFKTYRNMRNKKSKEALVHLGTMLHAVQDQYAHAYYDSKEDFYNTKNPSAAQKRFHSDYDRYSNNHSANMDEHRKNKDNIKRDWVNNNWVDRSKSANKRYTGAINSSKNLLNLC